MNDSNAMYLAVTSQPIPISWLDGDIGNTGIRGSSTFSSNVFTLTGAGLGTFYNTTDGVRFADLPLVGDGTIVARVIRLQGSSSSQAGVMIRETPSVPTFLRQV